MSSERTKWTTDQLAALRVLAEAHVSLPDIAKALKRTIGSVRHRLNLPENQEWYRASGHPSCQPQKGEHMKGNNFRAKAREGRTVEERLASVEKRLASLERELGVSG